MVYLFVTLIIIPNLLNKKRGFVDDTSRNLYDCSTGDIVQQINGFVKYLHKSGLPTSIRLDTQPEHPYQLP